MLEILSFSSESFNAGDEKIANPCISSLGTEVDTNIVSTFGVDGRPIAQLRYTVA